MEKWLDWLVIERVVLDRGWEWSRRYDIVNGERVDACREMNTCLWVWLMYSGPATCLLHLHHIWLLRPVNRDLCFQSHTAVFLYPTMFTETWHTSTVHTNSPTLLWEYLLFLCFIQQGKHRLLLHWSEWAAGGNKRCTLNHTYQLSSAPLRSMSGGGL